MAAPSVSASVAGAEREEADPPGRSAQKVSGLRCDFAEATGRPAVIGALKDLDDLVTGDAGTWVSADVKEMS